MGASEPFYEANRQMYDIARLTAGIWGPLRPTGVACNPANSCAPGNQRTTDPECRSYPEQVNAYMKRIIGENPYQIVKEQ